MPTLRLDDMRRNPARIEISEVLGTKHDPGLYRLGANEVDPATTDRYCAYVARYAAWIAAREKRPAVLTDLEAGLVKAFLGVLQRSTSPQTGDLYSGSTLRNAWAGLVHFGKWLATSKLVRDEDGRNVLREVEAPIGEEHSRVPLTPAQLGRVLELAQFGDLGVRNHAIICTAVGAGLRRRELRLLRVGDVLFSDMQLQVRREYAKGGKRRQTDRLVDMDADLARVLKHWVTVFRGDAETDDPLFTNADGSGIGITALRRLAQRIQRDAGLPKFCLHQCRHTWATYFRRIPGNDVIRLKTQGGWEDLRMAERYSHEVDESPEQRRVRPGPLSVLRNGGRVPTETQQRFASRRVA
jgi:integrase